MDTPLTRNAHAKVNLILRVGAPLASGPRAGYHPVCTWMHAIDLHDTLTLEQTPRSSLETRWESGDPAAWDPGDDLVTKAHRALEAHAGRELPTRIRVTKRIPDGAGLGGGSSDAAAALVGLRDLHTLDIHDDDLSAIGATLGADVAFFIDPPAICEHTPPRPAVATGIGERLVRCERLDATFRLVLPGTACATRDVYAAFDRPGGVTTAIDEQAVRDAAAKGAFVIDASRNDLLPAAREVNPRLDALIRSIEPHTPVMMSGSGSALLVPSDAALTETALSGVTIRDTRLV